MNRALARDSSLYSLSQNIYLTNISDSLLSRSISNRFITPKWTSNRTVGEIDICSECSTGPLQYYSECLRPNMYIGSSFRISYTLEEQVHKLTRSCISNVHSPFPALLDFLIKLSIVTVRLQASAVEKIFYIAHEIKINKVSYWKY